jgi:magnesium chelatase family protein
MLARVHGAVLDGVVTNEVVIEIEVDRRWAAPRWTGWVQRAARECLVRAQAALRRCGFDVPPHCILMGAVPGDPPVRSAALDLPVAVGLLVATGRLPPEILDGAWFAGELTLAGSILPIRGALPLALAAHESAAKTIILPTRNAREVAPWVEGIEILGAQTLGDLLQHLLGQQRLAAPAARAPMDRSSTEDDDIIPGPAEARRALEVAAAGGHHLLLVGPPGSGKTLLASRLPRLLPPPTFEEARETATIWSAAGLLDPDHHDPKRRRPFRAPHHTVSFAGLLGGGNPVRPGEASLAHHGVLFLDELPEFSAGTLDILRHAVRTGEASIARADGTVRLPARFQLVAAANPCPCGYRGDPSRVCQCRPAAIHRHAARMRFPLGDVFDIRVRVRPVAGDGTGDTPPTISEVKDRVAAARERQADRARRLGLAAAINAALTEADVQRLLPPDSRARRCLELPAEMGGLAPAMALRAMRLARTVADLDGADDVQERHVVEAAQLADPDGPGIGPVPQEDATMFDNLEQAR